MNSHFDGKEQSLEDILKAREARARYQQHLTERFGNTVVCYKLNIPGPVKYSPLIRKIFDEGLSEFEMRLKGLSINIRYRVALYQDTGPEYFAAVKIAPDMLKRLTSDIEEIHPLGRLFDFDVLDAEGKQYGRAELGLEPRKCLLCGDDAFACGRARRHELDELTAHIEAMAREYFDLWK